MLVLLVGVLVSIRSRFLSKKAGIALQLEDVNERTNLIEVEIEHESKTIEAFTEKIVAYSQLKDLIEELSQCLYLEDTINALSNEVTKLFGGKEATVILYLFHSKTGNLGVSSSHKGEMKINVKTKNGDGFDQWVVKNMKPLLIEDTKADFRFDLETMDIGGEREIRSLVGVPLIVENKALGILRVDNPEPLKFSTEDLRFLRTIGDLGAIAIESAQLYEHVEQLAIRDSLTGLYLRHYFMDRIPEEISRLLHRKTELSFLMIDLDYFKKYNDTFGHIAGDIVLRKMGKILSKFFNEPGNLVCRYGGEEFSVLLPDCSKEKAIKLSEEVCALIASQKIVLRRQTTSVTVSIGVASAPGDATDDKDLIHKADMALYKAKHEGRNRVVAFEGFN